MLTTISRDAPVALDLETCRFGTYNKADVVALFRELEFYTILPRVPDPHAADGPAPRGQRRPGLPGPRPGPAPGPERGLVRAGLPAGDDPRGPGGDGPGAGGVGEVRLRHGDHRPGPSGRGPGGHELLHVAGARLVPARGPRRGGAASPGAGAGGVEARPAVGRGPEDDPQRQLRRHRHGGLRHRPGGHGLRHDDRGPHAGQEGPGPEEPGTGRAEHRDGAAQGPHRHGVQADNDGQGRHRPGPGLRLRRRRRDRQAAGRVPGAGQEGRLLGAACPGGDAPGARFRLLAAHRHRPGRGRAARDVHGPGPADGDAGGGHLQPCGPHRQPELAPAAQLPAIRGAPASQDQAHQDRRLHHRRQRPGGAAGRPPHHRQDPGVPPALQAEVDVRGLPAAARQPAHGQASHQLPPDGLGDRQGVQQRFPTSRTSPYGRSWAARSAGPSWRRRRRTGSSSPPTTPRSS